MMSTRATTTQCPHPPAEVTPRDLYTYECGRCGTTTFPMHPDCVAQGIGPRRAGFTYWSYCLDERVTVLEVCGYSFDWRGWWVVEQGDDGRRRHRSTQWDPRNIALTGD